MQHPHGCCLLYWLCLGSQYGRGLNKNCMQTRITPNKRHRREFLHYRTLLGMSRQEQADFCWADMKRFFKVSLWDKSHTCQGCYKQIETFEEATLDHIVPHSKGGRTKLANLQLMHGPCNTKKSSTITQYISAWQMRKACTPPQSHRGTITRRHRGLSVNGKGY